MEKIDMSIRKYLSEFGLNMINEWIFVLQQDQLDTIKEFPHSFHIYMIARRPRITLDPDVMIFTEEHVEGQFKIQKGNSFDLFKFNVPNHLGANVRLECPYPHTEYKIYNDQGNLVSAGNAAALMTKFAYENTTEHEALDLEVLYIGQAYGDSGERTAPDRLVNHSTLQEIYADTLRKTPDRDIWILLCSFERMLMTSFDGTASIYGTTDEEDLDHITTVLKNPITMQQEINFTEAGLIRYFQPEYNDKFKYNFPNPAHSTYSQCYELDLNALSIELNTEELMSRLWSPNISREWIHLIEYPLHSKEQRKYMFDFFG
jgi:hypothetical protein